jgi:predicted esterase
MQKIFRIISVCISLVLATTVFAALIFSPSQPTSGPGGSSYTHTGVVTHTYGSGKEQYWIFEPSQPTPQEAPLIVFLHGYGVLDTTPYEAWIEHLVKRGNIVVYPKYQEDLSAFSISYTTNAISAIKNSLIELQSGHVTPDISKVAIVGHSAGGMIAANIASLASANGIPSPKALMVIEPGLLSTIPLADITKISNSTLLLSVVGEEDQVAGDAAAKTIYLNTTQISAANKDYIIVRRDDHGTPALRADHGAPTDIPLDSIDYYGFWKLFDGLTDAAFYGQNRSYALGDNFSQRFMGTWSDGVSVRELYVTDNPSGTITPPPPPAPVPQPPPMPPLVDTTPPIISGISISNKTQTSVTIIWTTDEPSTSQIEYGPTSAYGFHTPLNSSLVTFHSQSLSGLAAGTTYNYRVSSSDSSNNLTKSSSTFVTATAIVVPPPPPPAPAPASLPPPVTPLPPPVAPPPPQVVITAKPVPLYLLRTLLYGSRGSEVISLQKFLMEKGYLKIGKADGIFGPLTRAAVRQYQCVTLQVCQGNESTTGYGQVGRRTRAQILKDTSL